MATISKGNSKLGKIPNISMTPVLACKHDAPCRNGLCYAIKFTKAYPSVRKAWKNNLDEATKNPDKYWADIYAYILKHKPEYFRFHVGGDILNQEYLDNMICVAVANPKTKFMTFTKMYDLDYSLIPDNMTVVFSKWPTWNKKEPDGMPVAYFVEREIDKPDGSFLCAGECQPCGKYCWHMKKNESVTFVKH